MNPEETRVLLGSAETAAAAAAAVESAAAATSADLLRACCNGALLELADVAAGCCSLLRLLGLLLPACGCTAAAAWRCRAEAAGSRNSAGEHTTSGVNAMECHFILKRKIY